MWYPFKNRKKKVKKVKRPKPPPAPKPKFKRKHRRAYKKMDAVTRNIKRTNCLHLSPPLENGPTWWHCDMGDGRKGDCLIFLGKKRECEFRTRKEQPLSKEDILAKVEKKLEEQKHFTKCLEACVCPKCGFDLEEEYVDLGQIDYYCYMCDERF